MNAEGSILVARYTLKPADRPAYGVSGNVLTVFEPYAPLSAGTSPRAIRRSQRMLTSRCRDISIVDDNAPHRSKQFMTEPWLPPLPRSVRNLHLFCINRAAFLLFINTRALLQKLRYSPLATVLLFPSSAASICFALRLPFHAPSSIHQFCSLLQSEGLQSEPCTIPYLLAFVCICILYPPYASDCVASAWKSM